MNQSIGWWCGGSYRACGDIDRVTVVVVHADEFVRGDAYVTTLHMSSLNDEMET